MAISSKAKDIKEEIVNYNNKIKGLISLKRYSSLSKVKVQLIKKMI